MDGLDRVEGQPEEVRGVALAIGIGNRQQIEQLRTVEETALRVLDMINLSSELFKMETDRFKLDPQPVLNFDNVNFRMIQPVFYLLAAQIELARVIV